MLCIRNVFLIAAALHDISKNVSRFHPPFAPPRHSATLPPSCAFHIDGVGMKTGISLSFPFALTLALTCTLLLSLLTPATGDFEPNQVAGLYFFVRGSASCEEDIRIFTSGPDIRGGQIRGRNFECRGGHLHIERGSSENGNVLTKYFADSSARIGVFYIGTVVSTITCGQRGGGISQFVEGEVWNFVDTRGNVLLDFFKVLGGSKKNKNLDKLANDKELVLRHEVEYLIIGDKCAYRQSWYVCFPGSATVQTRDGIKRMDELEIGDEVLSAPDVYSKVFMWTHKAPKERSTFVRIFTDAGNNVTMTPSHYLRASGVLKPAGRVRVGDTVELGVGGEARVVKVDMVDEVGFFNPQTTHGDLVVDGIVTSTYTKAVRPNHAHALLAPLRALYKASAWVLISSTSTSG